MRKEGECLTPELIDSYLEHLAEKGRSSSSLESYRRVLEALYRHLPEGKAVGEGTGAGWKAHLEEQGFSHATVDNRVSVWNGLAQYMGHREWQVEEFYREGAGTRPELSRAEYLGLLSAAKRAGKEKVYLLIKTLGGAGMRIQELPQLTAGAVRRGTVELEYHNARQQRELRLPEGLREELLSYMKRQGIREGPVFQSPDGMPMARSSINYYISAVGREARVGEGKANPRCLWRMHCDTRRRIRERAIALAEQEYQSMLEEEQLAAGWDA